MTQFHNSNSEENQEKQNPKKSSHDPGESQSNYYRYDAEADDEEEEAQEEAEARRLAREEKRAAKARQYAIYTKTQQGISYAVAALEILLGLRLLLGIAAANPDNVFANFIFGLSEPFVYPFSNLFTNLQFNGGAHIFDINLLFGMIVYLLLMFLANWLVRIIIGP